eukprot:4276578-Prymnesium_polylepis.1
MRALYSMRARVASSPTRPWRWLRSAMTSSWTGCIISLVPGRKRWPFPNGDARPEEFALFSFDVVPRSE